MSLRLPSFAHLLPCCISPLLPVNSNQPSVTREVPPLSPPRFFFSLFTPWRCRQSCCGTSSPKQHCVQEGGNEQTKKGCSTTKSHTSKLFGCQGREPSAWNTKEEVSLALERGMMNGWTEQTDGCKHADGLTGKRCRRQKK